LLCVSGGRGPAPLIATLLNLGWAKKAVFEF